VDPVPTPVGSAHGQELDGASAKPARNYQPSIWEPTLGLTNEDIANWEVEGMFGLSANAST
jgi:hypothetical protein